MQKSVETNDSAFLPRNGYRSLLCVINIFTRSEAQFLTQRETFNKCHYKTIFGKISPGPQFLTITITCLIISLPHPLSSEHAAMLLPVPVVCVFAFFIPSGDCFPIPYYRMCTLLRCMCTPHRSICAVVLL